MPKFVLFFGENGQSMIEYIGRFIIHYKKYINNDNYKLHLFPNSLTEIFFFLVYLIATHLSSDLIECGKIIPHIIL